MIKKTAWFGPAKKPDLIGVYETKDESGCTGFQHWNGKFWSYWDGCSVDIANDNAGLESIFQYVKWRGLAKNRMPNQRSARTQGGKNENGGT